MAIGDRTIQSSIDKRFVALLSEKEAGKGNCFEKFADSSNASLSQFLHLPIILEIYLPAGFQCISSRLDTAHFFNVFESIDHTFLSIMSKKIQRSERSKRPQLSLLHDSLNISKICPFLRSAQWAMNQGLCFWPVSAFNFYWVSAEISRSHFQSRWFFPTDSRKYRFFWLPFFSNIAHYALVSALSWTISQLRRFWETEFSIHVDWI